MDRFVNEHPIVSIAGAIALYSAGNTLFKALTAPKANPVCALGYGAQGHLTKSQNEELKQIQKELKAAILRIETEELEKIQSELRAASRMHSGQADRLKQLGGFGASTSTTTSSSSSHAMMPKEAAPTLLETQGASSGMFGRMRATPLLEAPYCTKRRVGKRSNALQWQAGDFCGSVANLYAMEEMTISVVR